MARDVFEFVRFSDDREGQTLFKTFEFRSRPSTHSTSSKRARIFRARRTKVRAPALAPTHRTPSYARHPKGTHAVFLAASPAASLARRRRGIRFYARRLTLRTPSCARRFSRRRFTHAVSRTPFYARRVTHAVLRTPSCARGLAHAVVRMPSCACRLTHVVLTHAVLRTPSYARRLTHAVLRTPSYARHLAHAVLRPPSCACRLRMPSYARRLTHAPAHLVAYRSGGGMRPLAGRQGQLLLPLARLRSCLLAFACWLCCFGCCRCCRCRFLCCCHMLRLRARRR